MGPNNNLTCPTETLNPLLGNSEEATKSVLNNDQNSGVVPQNEGYKGGNRVNTNKYTPSSHKP